MKLNEKKTVYVDQNSIESINVFERSSGLLNVVLTMKSGHQHYFEDAWDYQANKPGMAYASDALNKLKKLGMIG